MWCKPVHLEVGPISPNDILAVFKVSIRMNLLRKQRVGAVDIFRTTRVFFVQLNSHSRAEDKRNSFANETRRSKQQIFGGLAMRFATRVMMWVFAAALSTLSPFAFGQAVYGSIYGSVTDATGAIVPGANITVTDTAKGTSTNVKADGSGEFRVDHLIPDVCRLEHDDVGAVSRQFFQPVLRHRPFA